MAGDDRTKQCARCDKPVRDVAAMTLDEVRALQARGTAWCGRVPVRGAAIGLGLALASAGCSVLCGPHLHAQAPVAVAPEQEPEQEPEFTPAPSPPATYTFSDEDDDLYMLGEVDVAVELDPTVGRDATPSERGPGIGR